MMPVLEADRRTIGRSLVITSMFPSRSPTVRTLVLGFSEPWLAMVVDPHGSVRGDGGGGDDAATDGNQKDDTAEFGDHVEVPF
jgi:hypothetical protein